MKEHYFYESSSRRKITFCLLIGDESDGPEYGTILSRGIAICSEKDNFSKKIGRAIASGRAKKAVVGKSYAKVRRSELSGIVPEEIKYKGTAFPDLLTNRERSIVNSIQESLFSEAIA